MLLCMVFFSCSKESSNPQQEIAQDFKALVMGGKSIDPTHTWSTASNTSVSVSVSLDAGSTYTIFLTLSDPTTDTNAKYVGMAKIKSGETKTIYATLPTPNNSLYATCYNGIGNAICLPVENQKVTFDSSHTNDFAENATEPTGNYMFYAFEFPGNNAIRDFDYNDLILRISIPEDNGDGTYTSHVDIVAIGSDMSVYVLYNGQEFGDEVHTSMGIAKSSQINTSSFTRKPRRHGDLTFVGNDMSLNLGCLPFTLRVEKSDGTSSNYTQQVGEPPLFVAINGDLNGLWYYPREGANIGLAYLLFSTWANNQQSATTWYDSSNASKSYIITWE